MQSWAKLFPEGRTIYYEGNDPKGFIKEIKAKFGFDPSKDNSHWGEKHDGWISYSFHCPVEHLDEIYGGQYPMGS